MEDNGTIALSAVGMPGGCVPTWTQLIVMSIEAIFLTMINTAAPVVPFNNAPQHIRTDNGVYASAPFQLACEKDNQDLTFCAAGSHWQNGMAEHHIGVITQMAHTILLHAMAQWPGIVMEEFLPFSIRHACTFHNASPYSASNTSPHELFTGNPTPWKLTDFLVFGCPVFILDKHLQHGDSLPKWKARIWLGIYVGHSLQHSGQVLVIYNPTTTHVSPQFHVVFDDQFTTINGDPSQINTNFIQGFRIYTPFINYCPIPFHNPYLHSPTHGHDPFTNNQPPIPIAASTPQHPQLTPQ
jgi:hypothetical protein